MKMYTSRMNDLLLRSVMMVMVVWLVFGWYKGGLGSGKA